MKKLFTIAMCFVGCLFLCGCGSFSSRNTIKNNLIKLDKRLTNAGDMGKIAYNFYELTPDVIKFIKTESELKKLYDEKDDDRMIVMYMYGGSCPFGNAFLDAVKKIKNDKHYRSFFKFYGRDVSNGVHFSVSVPCDATKKQLEEAERKQQTFHDYMNACGTFSVFNPPKKQVFTIDAVGYEEAAKLPKILESLIDW